MGRFFLYLVLAGSLFVTGVFGTELTDSLSLGNLELKSAAQLAFGPDGILFIADSHNAAIFAVDTKDWSAPRELESFSHRLSTGRSAGFIFRSFASNSFGGR